MQTGLPSGLLPELLDDIEAERLDLMVLRLKAEFFVLQVSWCTKVGGHFS